MLEGGVNLEDYGVSLHLRNLSHKTHFFRYDFKGKMTSNGAYWIISGNCFDHQGKNLGQLDLFKMLEQPNQPP